LISLFESVDFNFVKEEIQKDQELIFDVFSRIQPFKPQKIQNHKNLPIKNPSSTTQEEFEGNRQTQDNSFLLKSIENIINFGCKDDNLILTEDLKLQFKYLLDSKFMKFK